MNQPLLRRKLCIECIERFETTDRGQHYCSLACAIKANPPPAPPKPRGRPKLVKAPKAETTKGKHHASYSVGEVVGAGGWVILAVHPNHRGAARTAYLTACPKCSGSKRLRVGVQLRQSAVCRRCANAVRNNATHCKRGHAFDPAESYAGFRQRKCRQCDREQQAAERRAKGCRENKPRTKRPQ